MGLPWRRCSGQGPHPVKTLEPRGFSRVESGFSKTTGILGFLLGWPWEAQSSPGVAMESWGFCSSHYRAIYIWHLANFTKPRGHVAEALCEPRLLHGPSLVPLSLLAQCHAVPLLPCHGPVSCSGCGQLRIPAQ